jgi:hypothetical protein
MKLLFAKSFHEHRLGVKPFLKERGMSPYTMKLPLKLPCCLKLNKSAMTLEMAPIIRRRKREVESPIHIS